MSKVVLVTGATGKQGGALIEWLLDSPQAKDFTILAVTRNADSKSAQKLKEKGAKILKGDLDDIPSIFAEAKKLVSEPIWGVFSVQVPNNVKVEEAQGKALVDEAVTHKAKMFVYTSVERGGNEKSYDDPTPVPHFASKYNIEHHLVEKAGAKGDTMNWTILRPAMFMENFMPGLMATGVATVWNMMLKDKPVQLISVHDIGYFAAQAFINPSAYNTRGISLAGDELTYGQLKATYKEKTGQELQTTFQLLAKFMLWMATDLRLMFEWFVSDGFGVDIQALRREHPQLLTFSDWLVNRSGIKAAA